MAKQFSDEKKKSDSGNSKEDAIEVMATVIAGERPRTANSSMKCLGGTAALALRLNAAPPQRAKASYCSRNQDQSNWRQNVERDMIMIRSNQPDIHSIGNILVCF